MPLEGLQECRTTKCKQGLNAAEKGNLCREMQAASPVEVAQALHELCSGPMTMTQLVH